MRSSNLSPARRTAQRGQVMVLGVLSMLVVSLVMLLTLNVGQTVFNKIKLQQIADASAFSNATQVARAYNFFAYTNRANIGSLVASASLHSYMSVASAIPGAYKAAAQNYLIIAMIELPLCLANPVGPHCPHLLRDLGLSRKYNNKARSLANQVRDLDRTFQRTISMLDLHMDFIHRSQQLMQTFIVTQFTSDTLMSSLKKEFAPRASDNAQAVRTLNVTKFNGTIESNKDKRKWVPTEIANGSQWSPFIYKRSGAGFFMTAISPNLLREFVGGGDHLNTVISYRGESRTIKGPSKPKKSIAAGNHGPEGDSSAGYDEGGVLSFTYHCPLTMYSPFNAWVSSSTDDGEHKSTGGTVCSGERQHRLRCLGNPQGCFTLFKISAEEPYNQPPIYSVLHQDMRGTDTGQQAPWEVNEEGRVYLSGGGQIGEHSVQLSDNISRGTAMSRAMAYYHLPTSWKENPNFFNPYWRAKLHNFDQREALQVLTASGDQAAATALSAAMGLPLP